MQPTCLVQYQAILGSSRGKLVGHEPVATDPQLHPHRRDRQHCRRGPHPWHQRHRGRAEHQPAGGASGRTAAEPQHAPTGAQRSRGAVPGAGAPHRADLARAQAMVTSGDIEPAGPLRISSSAFGRHVLAPLLPSLQQRYPQLQLELRLTDRAVQHGPEAVDASIRIGAQLEDGVVARQLARVPFVFCASPAYLKARGTPQQPSELGGHRGLLHRFPTDGRPLRWGLLKDGQRVDAALPPSMVCDDIDALATLAAGAGITGWPPSWPSRTCAMAACSRCSAPTPRGARNRWGLPRQRPPRFHRQDPRAVRSPSGRHRAGFGCEPQRVLNTPRLARLAAQVLRRRLHAVAQCGSSVPRPARVGGCRASALPHRRGDGAGSIRPAPVR